MDDATLAVLRTAASALFDIAFAGMVGAVAMQGLLGQASRRRASFLAATATALAAQLAWMALQALSVTELPPADALLASGGVIADTQFGRAWAVATLALVACGALALAGRQAPPVRRVGLALAVVAGAHAVAGHAGANGQAWLVAVTALHALGTGAWAGSVFAAAWVDADAIRDARHAARLSSLATMALAVTAATGVACAWHGLGGAPAALAPSSGSPWGRLLDAKLALVAIAVALGGFNRFAVMPSLPAAGSRFVRVLRVESVVLLAVLVAAALLANGEPPGA